MNNNSAKNPKTQVPPILALIGARGFGREVMPMLIDSIQFANKQGASFSPTLYFIEAEPKVSEFNNIPVITESEFLALPNTDRYFNVAIADSKFRQQAAERLIKKGVKPYSLQASDVISYAENEIGEGAIICARSIITSNVKIGKFFHANLFSYVAHDCVIGDFVTFAPRVNCNGYIHIGDHAYIGTAAVIKQGTKDKPIIIGEGAIIGMGAVVTKDVPPFTTVVGNPARELIR